METKQLKTIETRQQVSSMIHSARPIVMPVANIVFCCFVFLDLKSRDGRTTCAKTMIPTGHDFGLAEWINKILAAGSALLVLEDH